MNDPEFARFANYIAIEIPVSCGNQKGKVYTFSRKDHLKNGLLKEYKEKLSDLIEKKKYVDSQFFSFDVGPTIAVADLVEEGEYQNFIKSYNSEHLQLTGLEHVLKVQENGYSHHILPLEDEGNVFNNLQMGLMRYSIYFRLLNNPDKDPNEEALKWIIEDSEENAKRFREILESTSCKVNHINGFPKIYKNCTIYQDLGKRVTEIFKLKEDEVEEVGKRVECMTRAFSLGLGQVA